MQHASIQLGKVRTPQVTMRAGDQRMSRIPKTVGTPTVTKVGGLQISCILTTAWANLADRPRRRTRGTPTLVRISGHALKGMTQQIPR